MSKKHRDVAGSGDGLAVELDDLSVFSNLYDSTIFRRSRMRTLPVSPRAMPLLQVQQASPLYLLTPTSMFQTFHSLLTHRQVRKKRLTGLKAKLCTQAPGFPSAGCFHLTSSDSQT